ncbi:MAG: MgtC/SapB family protein [Alphaproteobacteria bacterium]|nr:MgtC/SapB family protein [Alphaproteobacteria bacterium]
MNEILFRLGAALAIGLLIGLERGWQGRDMAEGSRIAGIRTFGIIGLFGGAAGLIAESHGGWVLAGALAALGAIAAAAHFRSLKAESDVSITTLTALLCTFALAALAGLGNAEAAGAAAVVMALLLGIKPEIHGFVRRIRRDELLATIRLLLVSVVVLPILPDKGFGPGAVLNPYRIWWMVVLVAALSYVGYVAVRAAGARRGVLLLALAGGLASSTAVALNLARLGRQKALSPDLIAAGTVTASAVMFPRIFLIGVALAPALAQPLAAMVIPATGAGLAAAWWLIRRTQRLTDDALTEEGFAARNPLDLRTAIQFGALLALIMVLSHAARDLMGGAGLIALAAVSGLADTDAITLSLADAAAKEAIAETLAAGAIVTALAVNTVFKAGLVVAIAGWPAGLRVSASLGLALAAGALGYVLTLMT